jgi:ferredoxin-thioredoxin reductase catalytic subunit
VDINQLFEILRKSQEPRGYYFNKDKELVCELLGSLIVNRERYGYMSCPCRLASDDISRDADIICPCAYRAADVEEYGSCYCNLYVSSQWNQGKRPHKLVPERRPSEKRPY